ncbi:hypothetical protein C8R45DRAFT_1107523 [Mycena sanguinolenta]|nr:hypothetical protein C8R45DRAFT_1107523 [Mycena sanguinolenta]
MSETPTAKEQLAAHFEKSATVVRAYADDFERSYGRPALQNTSAFFDEYPISTIFIAIFSSLAIIPVITFLALSVFAIVSLTFLALCCAFVVSSAVILFFRRFLVSTATTGCLQSVLQVSILVLCLVAAFFATGFFTVLAISIYLAYRFVTLVRSQGHEGVRSWAVEAKTRFIPSTRREASDGSAVVVDLKEPPPEDSLVTDPDAKQEDF